MSEMVKISINDKEFEAQKGSLLIDALLEENILIPHFCYHQALGKDGNCRMCMVEIEGQKRPQIACDTPVKAGMVVRTKGEKIEKVRKDILELQLVNHPLDCPTCDQAGECKLQDYYMDSGFYVNRVNVQKNHALKKVDLGRNVMLDQERCVLCTRCVRFFRNITKTNELGVHSRADHSVIGTFPGMDLQSPYAMNVVDLCPVGALTSKDFRFKQRVWFMETFEAICNGCSKGCNIHVDHRKEKYQDDTIFRFRPKVNKAVNGHFICDEGRLSYKKENENRLNSIICNKEVESFNNAKASVIKSLKEEKNILIVVSPMLSYEELKVTQALANRVKATISGYSPQYFDDTFEDNMLKTNDKSPNRKSLEALNISEDEKQFNDALRQSSLVVIVQNSYFDDNHALLSGKKVIHFTPHNSSINTFANIIIGTSSFLEKSGTYINCDGIKQEVISKINKDNKAVDLIEFIHTINLML
ncbi:MAG: 2Fe-2S iron-sulfur cluster-binding protein [Arcobacteraceae bacterium]